MAKSRTPSNHDRLLRAAERARVGSQPGGHAILNTSGKGIAKGSSEGLISGSSQGTFSTRKGIVQTAMQAGRTVKFPNQSSALRQYVETAREKTASGAGVRLRTSPIILTSAPPAPALPGAPPAPQSATARVRFSTEIDPDAVTPIRTMERFGDIVRRARRRQRLTQTELAVRAGTGRRFVSDVEAGKPTVEFERLMKLCRSLGITLFAIEPDDGE